MGTNGIHPELGYTTPDPEEAILKHTALQLSIQSFVLADPSKLSEVSFAKIADLSATSVITLPLSPEIKDIYIKKLMCLRLIKHDLYNSIDYVVEVENLQLNKLNRSTGQFIEDWLEKEGVSTQFVKVEEDTRINIKLKEAKGEETELNRQDPFIPSEKYRQFEEKLRQVQPGDTVVLAGSIPSSLSPSLYTFWTTAAINGVPATETATHSKRRQSS